MIVTKNQTGETIRVLGDIICIKLKAEQSLNQMSVMTVEVSPGNEIPLHRHVEVEESYYILSGSVTVQVETETFLLTSGDFVYIPAGAVHSYANHTDRPACFLAWTVGGAIDQFFLDIAEEIRSIPEDLAKMPKILAKHSIEVVESD